MAERPAKRQRRSTVVVSDDEDQSTADNLPLRSTKTQRQLELDHGGEDATLSLSPSRTRSRATVKASNTKTAKPSPKSTPEKSRKTRKTKEPEKSKAINSFFGKVSEDQRWQRKSTTPEGGLPDPEDGDAIEDDDLSDSSLLGREKKNDLKTALDRRKNVIVDGSNGSHTDHNTPPSSTQRFIKPSHATKQASTDAKSKVSHQRDVHRPWADRYGPETLDELAIHKKKAADVKVWFDSVLANRNPCRLLILKGPAGSGKTTTVNLLSNTLGFLLSHWQNPSFYDSASSGSVASQFGDFLSRGGSFGSLSLGTTSPQVQSNDPAMGHVLLVEDFPAGMMRSSGLDSFRSVILQFLARSSPTAAVPFQRQQSSPSAPPLVMIISETLLSSSTAFSDSFTAHRLLGPNILHHPLTTVIEFNPVAPTFVTKALDLVMRKEAHDSKRKRVPGNAVLQKLSEMGDIRNAVSSLEFLCVRNDVNGEWSGTLATKSKKSLKSSVALTEMETSSLQLISQRETTLDMFHAAGKIVYNKREDPRINDSNAGLPPKPPEHLMHLYSPKLSQVDIESLLNETGTDIQTFISTLHENHVLSCNGDLFVDCFGGCADILSISDVLNPDSRRTIRSQNNNVSTSQQAQSLGAFDALRQDEISFNVATRGLLFNLPYPVHRAAPTSGRKQDSFKMFYPTSLRLWKVSEETDALIDLFIHNELAGVETKARIKTEPENESVANWTVRANLAEVDRGTESLEDAEERSRKVTPSRQTLTLEILPYLAKIQRARKEDIKTVSKITRLTGSSVQVDGDEPSDDDAGEETIIAARKVSGGSRFGAPKTSHGRKSSGSPTKGIREDAAHDGVDMERLFLEDDDIVDA